MSRLRIPWLAAAAFLALGWAFVPRLGVEADEAIAGAGIYPGANPWFSVRLFGGEIPLMLLSYLGALKAWILNLVFLMTPPSAVSLRLPWLAAGAASIVLFARFAAGLAGPRAALFATLLLATDTTYLLTTAIDWGPTALHQFLKMAALALLLRPSPRRIFAAFLLFGLALWDKALFAWALAGLAAAGAVYFAEIRPWVSRRNFALAAAGLLLGASPLIAYNIARPLDTLRANARPGGETLDIKWHLFRETLNARAFYGFLVAAEPGPRPGAARSALQRFSAWADGHPETPRANWNVAALGLAILALPLLWRSRVRRPMLFALLAGGLAWLAMLATGGAGAAAHHIVLIWPFPALLIALALDGAADRLPRWLPAATCALLCLVNLRTTNHYAATVVRNGGTTRWTTAFDPLLARLRELRAPRVLVADWGIFETVHLLGEGRLRAAPAAAFLPGDHLWLAHTPEARIVAPGAAAIESEARAAGYEKTVLETIYDRNGRPVFVLFRFRRP
jgi:hypothetical protein